ncbi:MAG: globin domain-containing protein [Acidimicrobiales bacterium]
MSSPSTLYDRVGGDAFFETLTRRFYAAVRRDQALAPLYPADDEAFEQARQHLQGFLIQFWGGPASYSEQRGHPQLRMRHAPFAIGAAERDAWVRHMRDAVEASGAGGMERAQLLTYFESAATHMINTAEG